MADEWTPQLRTGLTVIGNDGGEMGTIDGIVSDVDSPETRWISVENRLVPVGDVTGVSGNRVTVDVPSDRLGDYPLRRDEGLPPTADPSRQKQALGMHDDVVANPRDGDLHDEDVEPPKEWSPGRG